MDADGNVYVLDAGNHRVRLVTPAGLMRTVAGTGESEEIPFPAYAALFNGRQANRSPLFGASHLAVDSAARSGTTLYVGEFRGTALLRSVSLESGRIETFSFPNTEGTLWALVVDDSGTVYIGDGRGIRMRRPNGAVAVIADSGEYGFDVGGMAVDRFGNIWSLTPPIGASASWSRCIDRQCSNPLDLRSHSRGPVFRGADTTARLLIRISHGPLQARRYRNPAQHDTQKT